MEPRFVTEFYEWENAVEFFSAKNILSIRINSVDLKQDPIDNKHFRHNVYKRFYLKPLNFKMSSKFDNLLISMTLILLTKIVQIPL